MTPRTVADIVASLPEIAGDPLPRPAFERHPDRSRRLVLGVESMRRHMTDEGAQLQDGLAATGYELWGYGYPPGETDVRKILARDDAGTVLIQDKREWDPRQSGCFVPQARFTGTQYFRESASASNTFRVTVHKDAHQHPGYNREWHDEFGIHAWVIYYHPDLMRRLSPWLRPDDLIRTYHSLDPAAVPAFGSAAEREIAILSGASSPNYYPLRHKIRRFVRRGHFRQCTVQPHPGYNARGCQTPEYLRLLNRFRVSIATSSRLGYALRKIIESTACGCVVVTDLPMDDVLPGIDQNLVRVHPDIPLSDLSRLVLDLAANWSEERQRHFASVACRQYDYRVLGQKLADDIERKAVA